MTYDELFDYYGSQKAIAAALGVSQPAVSYWSTRSKVPKFQQLRAEAFTSRVLVADDTILQRPSKQGA